VDNFNEHYRRIFPAYLVLFGVAAPRFLPDSFQWPVILFGVVSYVLYLRMRVDFDRISNFGVRSFWNEFWIGPTLLVFAIPIWIGCWIDKWRKLR